MSNQSHFDHFPRCQNIRLPVDERIEHCEASIGTGFGNDGPASSYLIDLYTADHDYPKALDMLAKVFGGDSQPSRILFLLMRSDIYARMGRYDDALADVSELERLSPKHVDAQRCWVRALANHDLTLAQQDCKDALTAEPGNRNINDSMGLIYFRLGQFDQAESQYKLAYGGVEQRTVSRYMLGLCERKNGDATAGDADVAAAVSANSTTEGMVSGYGITP